jgi:predicted DNA-binding protein
MPEVSVEQLREEALRKLERRFRKGVFVRIPYPLYDHLERVSKLKRKSKAKIVEEALEFYFLHSE